MAKNPVATGGDPARIGTAIGLHIVAVIAGFVVSVLWQEIAAHHFVATSGEATTGGTAVAGFRIPVVTLLANINDTITTVGRAVPYDHLLTTTRTE